MTWYGWSSSTSSKRQGAPLTRQLPASLACSYLYGEIVCDRVFDRSLSTASVDRGLSARVRCMRRSRNCRDRGPGATHQDA